MIEKQQCNVITTLGDPGKLRMCELPDGHAGQHQTTYDGRDYHWGAHAADAWNEAAADPTALLDRIATLTADLAEFRAWTRQLQPACPSLASHGFRLATVIDGSRVGETVGLLVEFKTGECVVDLGCGDGLAMLRIEQLRPWVDVQSVTPILGGKLSFER